MNVKDRHNGNILVDAEGHVVHIDYGFMFTNAPGVLVAFEGAAFKLTKDYLDVLGGENGDMFGYYRSLVIRGFLEARQHYDEVKLMVQMMLTGGSKLPCFAGGAEAVLDGLRQRFMMGLPESEVIARVNDLLNQSVNNWRSVQYDAFQRFTNGIK